MDRLDDRITGEEDSSGSRVADELNREWSALDSGAVEDLLQTSRLTGLKSAEVELRRRRFGRNVLAVSSRTGWIVVIGRQFADALIWILIAAAVLSLAVGEPIDALTIIAIVVLNGILGFVQEWKAERAVDALRQLLTPECTVLRDGEPRRVPAPDLVPGDIVVLETGDRIPADLRQLEVTSLRVDESALTGESRSVAKQTDPAAPGTELALQKSMAWMGTSVTTGRGLGVVTATGPNTQFGKIARLTDEVTTGTTPLQKKLSELGRLLGLVAVGISVLVVVAGLLSGKSFLPMLMTGISLAVAIVPEGLPAVVTITLALGIRAMVRRRALLRRLQAAEAIGAANVVCTDKTGTLTQNQMTVQNIWLASDQMIDVTGVGYDPAGHFEQDGAVVDYRGHPELLELLSSGFHCNHATIHREDDAWQETGEPTEAALVVAAWKAWLNETRATEFAAEFSFSSERKRMTVVQPFDGRLIAHVKGAPDVILPLCSRFGPGDGQEVSPPALERIQQVIASLAQDGLRTLAIARRVLPGNAELSASAIEQDLRLLGIVGIIDPPRPEVPAAVARARSAGIHLIMITGDSADTALAVADRIGLHAERAIQGRELEEMDDTALGEALRGDALFARTTPEHKLRIVTALQKAGNVVGMTGDGVNDAPALRKADIGIAMGRRGTDVARGAADIVLTDDNFTTIINAVEEGRRQYDNIQKFVRYLLSSNTGEAVAIVLNIVFGGPLILLPVQILWMNLVTDGMMALALGMERAEPDIMRRPPRNPAGAVLGSTAIWMIVSLGAVVGLTTFSVFEYALRQPGIAVPVAQTVAFHCIIVIEWFNVLNFRTLRTPVLRFGLLSNRWMIAAIAFTVLLQIGAIYLPPMQRALHTVPLDWHWWLFILAVSAPILVLGETAKWWLHRRTADRGDTALARTR